jgi:hypothetical protein
MCSDEEVAEIAGFLARAKDSRPQSHLLVLLVVVQQLDLRVDSVIERNELIDSLFNRTSVLA